MDIQRRQLILVPDDEQADEVMSLSNQYLGRLDMLDELFNALHGAGDVDLKIKELVILIVEDVHGGGNVIKAVDGREKKEMVCRIVKIISSAISNRPETVKAVLCRWIEDLQVLAAQKAIIT